MNIMGISPTSSATTGTTGSTGASSQLGKSDFLKLLIAQLKNQDPMSPMDNTTFITQMAQFNTLEQLETLNQTIGVMVGLQSLSQASELVGRKVEIRPQGADDVISGTVSEVRMADGNIFLVVDGKQYSFSDLSAVLSEPQGSKQPAANGG